MSLAIQLPTQTLRNDLSWCLAQSKAQILRPIGEWVEQEIVIPNGPFGGERYRHHRHPVSRLWFDCLSGSWNRFAATGPTQNGKTLMCYVLPVLWHLFEQQETVIIGLPDMNMANDKWKEDFLPTIMASRYRELVPNSGDGSRGGDIKRGVTFRNGATLRFMTAGGGDKKRAAYTSRVLAVTETDGMDEAGEASREADKIEQLEGRTRAFGTSKRVYLECTVSIEAGRIWQEIKNGTDSKIVRPCPHCAAWVTPEREHLKGWQQAESEGEASDKAHWTCPACEKPWTEADRWEAARDVKLLHRGQEITPEGEIVGEPPKTQTLGFRWSAIDNPFETPQRLGGEEWKARRERDRENAERKMRQFVWTLPYEPPNIAITEVDPEAVQSRTTELKRGALPEGHLGIVVGVDTGKRKLHWEAKAVRADGGMAVIDYGIQPVDCDRLGVHRGLIDALNRLQEHFEAGWSGVRPSQVWIDSGYHEHKLAVYVFCQQMNKGCNQLRERYRPSKGYGEGQRMERYYLPTGKQRDIVYTGREFHVTRVRHNEVLMQNVQLVHINSDYWKAEFLQRLIMPKDDRGAYPAGAITLFSSPDPFEHADYSAQVASEHQIEKGASIVFEKKYSGIQNHFLDAGYAATAAGQFLADLKPRAKRMSLAEMAAAAKR